MWDDQWNTLTKTICIFICVDLTFLWCIQTHWRVASTIQNEDTRKEKDRRKVEKKERTGPAIKVKSKNYNDNSYNNNQYQQSTTSTPTSTGKKKSKIEKKKQNKKTAKIPLFQSVSSSLV